MDTKQLILEISIYLGIKELKEHKLTHEEILEWLKKEIPYDSI